MYTKIINRLKEEVEYQEEQAQLEHNLIEEAYVSKELARRKMGKCYEHAIAIVEENRRRRNIILDALIAGNAVPVDDIETYLDITFDQACKLFRIIEAKEHTDSGMKYVKYFALRS